MRIIILSGMLCILLVACQTGQPVVNNALPFTPIDPTVTRTQQPITSTPTPVLFVATPHLIPSTTPTPLREIISVPALTETAQVIYQQTAEAYGATQQAGYSLNSTEIVKAILATVTPNILQKYKSPDGKIQAEVIVYSCTSLASVEEDSYSYEILKITNLENKREWIAETQVISCQGVGAAGLGGLFWSKNSRYFYYTTSLNGVPDGGSTGWMGSFSRFDVYTGDKLSLKGLIFSPDKLKIAAGEGQDLVVWDLNGDELAHFQGKGVVPDGFADAWVHYFAWSPDSHSLAYIITLVPSTPTPSISFVLISNLELKQSTLLLESTNPEFIEVHWKSQNHLSLLGGLPFLIWDYDLVNNSVIPTLEITDTPSQ